MTTSKPRQADANADAEADVEAGRQNKTFCDKRTG